MSNLLDEFRSTNLTWDKATSRIYSPVTANASDENGRKLVVQIVNGGQVEDLTGATLHLYWVTRDKAHNGLDVFDAVDLKKGEFELSYTTGMLSNQGVLNANLVLIDTVGRVVSERFKITVTEGIDNDAIQSEDSFSSLTQALIEVGPRLNSLTAQLQQNTTVLQGIDKTFGDKTFATLVALQTAYPTGDAKRYIVAADGKWYYWSGSAWTAGQVAQAVGIVDKSQGLSQLSADLSLANYPFTNPTIRKDLLKFGVVLDATLIGADRTKFYTIGGLQKNYGASNITRIQVHEWDLITGNWAGGSPATAIRASWSRDNYTPPKTTEIVKLAAIGTNGFKVELLVDWTKIPDNVSYSWEGGHFHFFHPNTISNAQTFLPNIFKSRQNIDKTFPDNAFYTGHWFKKTVNAKECISTNLFGNEINLIFKGPRITINAEVVGYNVSLYAAIDGVGSSWIDLAVSGEKVIKSGLADTEHILTLWTQPRFGDTADSSPFFSGKGSINITGFNVPTFPIYGSKRTLVFYGDSITAGQEDRFVGYAKRIEQFLPVNTIRIAQPAAPLVRRTDRPFIPTLQQFYNQSSDGTYARPAPGDVILINIGTNDTSGDVTQLEFETALTNLVTGLKIRHSGAPICLISPFGGYRATETANVANATGVYLVDTTGWAYATADNIHPNEAGATTLAQRLSTDLIDKFGFDYFNLEK